MRLSAARERIKFQVAGKSNQDLKDVDGELCNFVCMKPELQSAGGGVESVP